MNALFLYSHNMEDVESVGTRGLLKRAGFNVHTATFEDSLTIETKFGQTLSAQLYAREINVADYDVLIIPGGPYVKGILDSDNEVKNDLEDKIVGLVKRFNHESKMIAAICAGPRFLGRAGLLDGITYTAFTGSDKDAPRGHYDPSIKAMRKGHIITGRGAGVIYEFAYEIVKAFKGEDAADALLEAILH